MQSYSKSWRRAAAAVAFAASPLMLGAQGRSTAPARTVAASATRPYEPVDTARWGNLQWRMLGPAHTGRMVSVSGSVQRPGEYYVATTGGGVWKTADSGKTWHPVTDAYFGGTVGAVEVFPGNPDIVWAGGGEYPIRGNVSHGDGVWKTVDGGKTWSYMGLKETQYVSRIVAHPTNPDIAYVGALGHVFGPNPERGVYRTKDGGKTWQKVLFRNDSTGIGDLVMDPTNPNVLYAGFWQAGRKPWLLSSGGEGSTMFKTTDGGDHWTELKNNPGLPKGIWGNIGFAVAPKMPNRVWALIEAEEGGVYRSDDAGATWQLLNQDRNLRQRAWYYSKLTADPLDPNVVWAGNVGGFVSRDGGKTFQSGLGNGDTHQYWIAPNDPKRIAVAGDPGITLTYDGGTTQIRANLPTGQYYHVHLTNAFPYDVCGAEQDGGVDCFPGRFGLAGAGGGGRGGFGGGGFGAGGRGGRGGEPAGQFNFPERYSGAGGESGYVASDPLDPDVTFGGNYSGVLQMRNKRTGESARLDPWPLNPMGHDAKDAKYRFQWTFPIMNSPHDPKVLYAGGNVLFRSTDLGLNWKIVSPDLTRNDPATLGPSGGPLTKDQTSVEYYATIFAAAESPVTKGLVWTGSDDGLIYLSRNVGLPGVTMPTWTNVTPKDLPKWTRISIIEPSHTSAGTMYFAANRYEMDDFAPYLYKTTDYGKTWTRIVAGIPGDEFTRAIREDLVRPGLLYAATERSMYVSYDAGAHWQSLKRSLPPVPVHDIALRDDDIVIATMGRGFYAMEGITALREADDVSAGAHLYKPGTTYQMTGNIPVQYWLDKPDQLVSLELVDSRGRVVRKVASNDPVPVAGGRGGRGGGGGRGGFGAPPARVTNNRGLNTFPMSLQYPDGMNFRDAIYWAGNGLNGPLGPPGTYTIRMTVADGAPQTQTVRVLKDPRSKATEADLVEKFNFLMRIRDTVSSANKAVRTIRNARDQVDSIGKIIPGTHRADFEREANAMVDSTRLTEEELYQTKNEAGEDPLNFPVRLNNQVGALAGFVSANDRRPPAQAYDVWNNLVPQLNRQLGRLDTQWKTMLPRVNAVLKAAGMAPIVLSSDERGAPQTTFVP